jgi:hypothetical protein
LEVLSLEGELGFEKNWEILERTVETCWVRSLSIRWLVLSIDIIRGSGLDLTHDYGLCIFRVWIILSLKIWNWVGIWLLALDLGAFIICPFKPNQIFIAQ